MSGDGDVKHLPSHCGKQVCQQVKRALYSVFRKTLYSVKRALYSVKTQNKPCTLSTEIYCVKGSWILSKQLYILWKKALYSVERALYSYLSKGPYILILKAPYCQRSLMFGENKPCTPWKTSCILSKEPYILHKTSLYSVQRFPIFCAEKPFIPQKHPCTLSKEPLVLF